MSVLRLLSFLVLVLVILVAGVSAQPPGVKLPPQIKPGMPPKGPGIPAPKPPDPKGKNPLPPGPGIPPGLPPGAGLPPATLPGPGAPAPEKKDDIKWPKEINGKTVETIVKEMRTSSDPAVREAAVRALPMFGPKGREEGANELVEAMSSKESDWNVRLAAVAVAPTVLLGFAKGPDTALTTGLNTISNLLGHEYMHVRFEAVAAVAACGPYIRKELPKIVPTVVSRARESTTWQMRRAGVACLGIIGQGTQTGETPEDKTPPDTATVDALLTILKSDVCAAVRREAVNALIALGPVAGSQQKTWRTSLDNVFKFEKDKSVVLWTRVCILRNDPSGVKGNENHLNEVAKVLGVPEPGGRIEACQALALLGEEAITKLQALLDVITTIGEEPTVVIAAILAVTNMPSKDNVIVPILQNQKATHKNENVRKVAEEAIEYLAGRKKKK